MGPNPYSTLFGKEPAENIHRLKEENMIVDSFTAEHPTQQIFKQYLEDYVYDIIWQKLSEKDKLVAYGIAKSETGETGAVRKVVGMTVNQFNPYRKRLIKKGIVNGDTWGIVRFTLPYFEQFVISMYEGETYD